jgi:hypothetical protein
MNLRQVKRYLLVVGGVLLSSVAYGACDTANVTETAPSSEFVDHGDGTVTHTKTGLMWARCSEGSTGSSCSGTATTYNWKEALFSAESKGSYLGFTGWRLPSIKELVSLVENSCSSPAVNSGIFPGTENGSYWSSSIYSSSQANAWTLYAVDGRTDNVAKNLDLYVRLVRDISDTD